MVKPIVDLLHEMQNLMELKGENPFKIRAFEKAAKVIEDLGEDEDWAKRAREQTLTDLPGIGKGISQVLTEFLIEGKTTAKDELEASLPEGLRELTQVPGLGPKKALLLIEQLEIKTLGELEYACKENRLVKLPGFGEKTQAKILEGLHFLSQTRGQLRISDALSIAEKLLPILKRSIKSLRIEETGELRRRCETIAKLEFLVELPKGETPEKLKTKLFKAITQESLDQKLGLEVEFYFSTPELFAYDLARTTATVEHWKALSSPKPKAFKTEQDFYQSLELEWISPEMRETGDEVKLARKKEIEKLLPWDGVKGIFHNHTTRSDGSASLEEMVVAAKKRGYEYIGISDHSQSAFYAQGLKEAALAEQEKEIKDVQKKHPDIKIFWGVESDILQDGSLDYSEKWLKKFDFVVASIHSRFKMDKKSMTDRILKAIENPYTTMIGHLTGRLLLGRPGYELDFDAIVSTAAKNNVAIEINAHPARLDIDWRHGPLLKKYGCQVCINPDAHEVSGLDDVKYGVVVARKALLPTNLVLNSRSTAEIESWLRQK